MVSQQPQFLFAFSFPSILDSCKVYQSVDELHCTRCLKVVVNRFVSRMPYGTWKCDLMTCRPKEVSRRPGCKTLPDKGVAAKLQDRHVFTSFLCQRLRGIGTKRKLPLPTLVVPQFPSYTNLQVAVSFQVAKNSASHAT